MVTKKSTTLGFSEKTITQSVKDILTKAKIFHFKHFAGQFSYRDQLNQINRTIATKSGIPDLILCQNGKFIAIEIKVKNNKLRDLQIKSIEQIINSGGLCLVISDKTITIFRYLMDKYNNCIESVFNASDSFNYKNYIVKSNN